jgi:hypothetical protein
MRTFMVVTALAQRKTGKLKGRGPLAQSRRLWQQPGPVYYPNGLDQSISQENAARHGRGTAEPC